MEGEPDAEAGAAEQMHSQREAVEDGWMLWQGGQVRNMLHLVSAVAQWILLLACLIYLGVHFLRPLTVRARVQPSVCWPLKLCMGFLFFGFSRKEKRFEVYPHSSF